MDRSEIMLIIEANLDLIASIISAMEHGIPARQAIRLHAEILLQAAEHVVTAEAVENDLDRVLAEVLAEGK